LDYARSWQVDQQEALAPETFHRLSTTAKGRAALAVLDVQEPSDDGAEGGRVYTTQPKRSQEEGNAKL
jgi:hypothetical protein